jgi:DEAD/DEAH box helicase domain-containing protein
MTTFVVFDLETQRSADEVGGWGHIAEMKMAVGVVWDSSTEQYSVYLENQVFSLIDHLKKSDLIIGFNHIGFDFTVLSGYLKGETERQQFIQELKEHGNLDLLLDIKDRIGKRIKLESAARATLKVGKSADGLESLKWYKEYLNGDEQKLQMIIDYCKKDVEVTRDLYLHGIEKGEILYDDKIVGIKSIEVEWGESKPPEENDSSTQLSF